MTKSILSEDIISDAVVRRALVFLGFSDMAIRAYFKRSGERINRETIEDAISLGFDLERARKIETAKVYAMLDGDRDDVGEFTNNVLNINTDQDSNEGGRNG